MNYIKLVILSEYGQVLYYSSPPGILIKGLTIALLLGQLGSSSQNPQKLVLQHFILMDETCR